MESDERAPLGAQRGHSGNESNLSQGRRQGRVLEREAGVEILFQTEK